MNDSDQDRGDVMLGMAFLLVLYALLAFGAGWWLRGWGG